MTTVLTVNPLLFGIATPWVMGRVCRSWATSNGKRRVHVPTDSNILPNSIQNGTIMLDRYIRQTPGKKIVFGYSQGAQIAGRWLRRFPHNINPDELSFILIGNPERAESQGGVPGGKDCDGGPKLRTPCDSPYQVLDVARRDDFYAHHTPGLTGAALLKAKGAHSNYLSVNLDHPQVLSKTVVGTTTYLVVP